ncbi:hypothetical protein D3C79_865560 [compost metagenome]
MGLGLEGKLRGGKHIPHHKRSANVVIDPVAAVVRQFELCTGESTSLLSLEQMLTQFWSSGGIRHQLGHRFACLQQL